MSIPKQAVIWDESRNSSRERRPEPNAVRNALASLAALRRSDPALVQWVLDGHPNLTDDEHVARFGVSYRRGQTKAATDG